jgi:predicted NUDIX family NTP pyrophosphohydrolase
MDLKKRANLIIYRFQEKGLEIFLVNEDEEQDNWALPKGKLDEQGPQQLVEQDNFIELDPVAKENSNEAEEAWAVEGDWHDIPSLKGMLYEDAMQLKDKLKEMEKGTYFTLKEAFKKVLPHQYKFLKELKDILIDRSIKNL